MPHPLSLKLVELVVMQNRSPGRQCHSALRTQESLLPSRFQVGVSSCTGMYMLLRSSTQSEYAHPAHHEIIPYYHHTNVPKCQRVWDQREGARTAGKYLVLSRSILCA